MGLIRANAIPMLREHRLRPFSGACLTLGQADIYFDRAAFERMAKIAGVALGRVADTLSHRSDFAQKGYLSREAFFLSLGFNEVLALDKSRFEGAEIEFDLNAPAVPEPLRNRFDCIVDHGTMEHVFHVPNCLANIGAMLKPGGRVIHSAPGHNYFDHGFFMFSPTLFADYYATNDWIIHSIQVFQIQPERQETEAPFFADYEPGIFASQGAGGLDGKAYGTVCVVEKRAQSTHDKIPDQSYYSLLPQWAGTNEKAVPPPQRFSVVEDLAPPFDHDIGVCWSRALPDLTDRSDTEGHGSRSDLMVLEDGAPLGPAHSPHAAIRAQGGGRLSHWKALLYFSTSDNSDPNTNGRRYTLAKRDSS